MTAICQGILLLLIVGSLNAFYLDQQDPLELIVPLETSTTNCNCTTTESPLMFFHPPYGNEANAHLARASEDDNIVVNENKDNENDETIFTTVTTEDRGTNISLLKTLGTPENWNDAKPTLDFPKTPPDGRYKMASLHLDKGIFAFDFLQNFLNSVQPHDVPIDLIRDVVENRITAFKLLSKSMHMEVGFVALVGVCCVLACVIPGTELWLACRPIREDYKPSQHPGFLAFLLSVSVFILGHFSQRWYQNYHKVPFSSRPNFPGKAPDIMRESPKYYHCVHINRSTGMVAILVCNEASSSGIEKIPLVVETALQDLSDYHSGTTVQMRRCLTRSLGVASEAILADLDNVEELLGKPVQSDLATETGLDVALDALLDVANATQELASRTKSLLKEGERASERGLELSREVDSLRRELEAVVRDCPILDRPLCATLNPTGFGVALRLDKVNIDRRIPGEPGRPSAVDLFTWLTTDRPDVDQLRRFD